MNIAKDGELPVVSRNVRMLFCSFLLLSNYRATLLISPGPAHPWVLKKERKKNSLKERKENKIALKFFFRFDS